MVGITEDLRTAEGVVQYFRDFIWAIYRLQNPNMIESGYLDLLLSQYRGREFELFLNVQREYLPDPPLRTCAAARSVEMELDTSKMIVAAGDHLGEVRQAATQAVQPSLEGQCASAAARISPAAMLANSRCYEGGLAKVMDAPVLGKLQTQLQGASGKGGRREEEARSSGCWSPPSVKLFFRRPGARPSWCSWVEWVLGLTDGRWPRHRVGALTSE